MTAPLPSKSQVVVGSVPRLKNVQRSAVAAILILAAVLPLGLSTYEIGLATEVLIFGVLAMSIDILAGFAGRTSLGHGAIFGVATYVVVYANARAGYPPAVAFVLGVFAATAIAMDGHGSGRTRCGLRPDFLRAPAGSDHPSAGEQQRAGARGLGRRGAKLMVQPSRRSSTSTARRAPMHRYSWSLRVDLYREAAGRWDTSVPSSELVAPALPQRPQRRQGEIAV